MVCAATVALEDQVNEELVVWQPEHGVGTWHPCGRRLGPVYYEQRVNGTATGLFFVVSRSRYWLICALDVLAGLPVIGRFAHCVRRRMTVLYRWTWLHRGPQDVA
jgi:hypothetical protein